MTKTALIPPTSTEEQNRYDAAGQVFWLVRSSGTRLPEISSSGIDRYPDLHGFTATGIAPDSHRIPF